jgi:hypothetical protein
MSAIQSVISKGREVGFYDRVLNNDPANSVLVMGVLVTGGDDLVTLSKYDTLAAVLAGPSTEAAATGYSRIILDNTDLAAWTPNDVDSRIDLTLPLQTLTPNAGEDWDIAFVAYDPDSTGGTDSAIIPITFHEMRIDGIAVPTNGDDILMDLSELWVQAL